MVPVIRWESVTAAQRIYGIVQFTEVETAACHRFPSFEIPRFLDRSVSDVGPLTFIAGYDTTTKMGYISNCLYYSIIGCVVGEWSGSLRWESDRTERS